MERRRSDVAYAGSVIRQGETNALVAATGTGTCLGRTARLVEEAKTRGRFQQRW